MYRALYRKWRPSRFGDVVGQDFATTILENEVKSNKIGHAYLFIGSRGTGKTTCARIFAKAINCLCNEDTEKPCGVCSICKAAEAQSLQDIIELDAASNNGVNDIREICESTKFTPSVCKYKVYIIDEVHMLSTGAFNALLKTLEEPPSHVVFLLATTEVNKIPATILSRCQKFEFKKISLENITKRLEFVAKKENIALKDDAANIIAENADGAMRDALSILDKCASLNDEVTEELVCSTLFIADEKSIFNICESIINKDLKNSLYLLEQLDSRATSVQSIFSRILKFFSDLMVVKSGDYDEEVLNVNKKFLNEMQNLAKKVNLEKIFKILNTLEKFSENLTKVIDPKLQLKSFIIKICSKNNIEKETLESCNSFNKGTVIDNNCLIEKIENLEKEIIFLKEQIQCKTLPSNYSSKEIDNSNSLEKKDVPCERLLVERIENLEKEIVFLKQQREYKNLPLSYASALTKQNILLEKTKEDYLPTKLTKDKTEILKNAKEMQNWQEVLNTLKAVSPSVYIAFKGSKAYVSDPYVLIDSSKQIAFDLLKKSVQRDKIRDIIRKVTGKLYRLGPYKVLAKSEENSVLHKESDFEIQNDSNSSLRVFAKKAQDLGIDVIIESE